MGRDASPVGPRAGWVFFRQTVLLHFKYSGWPLLTPFYVFLTDGDGGRAVAPRKPAPETVRGLTVCCSAEKTLLLFKANVSLVV